MRMCPDNYDETFDKSGDNSSDCSTGNAHCRDFFETENKYVVKNQIGKNGSNTCHHRNEGMTGFSDCINISLADSKGDKPDCHDSEIFFSVI